MTKAGVSDISNFQNCLSDYITGLCQQQNSRPEMLAQQNRKCIHHLYIL